MIHRLAISARLLPTSLILLIGILPSLARGECGTHCTCSHDAGAIRTCRDGRWFVVESENFIVYCEQSETPARHLARHAEAQRAEIQSRWLGDNESAAWTPRCQIVLHSNLSGYVAAVGQGSERTVGSSLVQNDKGRIVSRRIDLLGGKRPFLSAALPHELTHVVLADRFADRPMPAWADEGVAILADPKAKQARHRADLRSALASDATFRVFDLVSMDQYPRPERMGTFYSQSASLVEYLIERKGHQQFLTFVERSASDGCDSALRDCYGIANAGELDRQWRGQIKLAASSN